jgi:hypothetical protein
MRLFLPVAALVTILMLGACASPTPYTPDPARPFEKIAAEFHATGAVALVKAPATAAAPSQSGRWLIDYQAWTGVAITICERELTARGMTSDPGAQRQLKLSIEAADTVAGDGYTAVFTGRNSSAMMAAPERQIDGAMMRVVVAMLSDARIVAYLTQ